MRCRSPARFHRRLYPGIGPRRLRLGTAVGVALGLVGLPSCTSGTPASPPLAASGGSANASSAAATPLPSARPPSGLNGFPTGIGRPVLAVKIDNTGPAHPQVGVADADIVYVEQVEGQLTRLMAIFSSKLPAQIGPVRSARESDLDLLRQYGRVDFAFSGANRGVLRLVSQTPVNDVSAPTVRAGYHREGSRPAPYNLFLRPGQVLAAKPAAVANDIGLRFASTVPTAGRASTGFSVRFGSYASVAVRYTARGRSWQILMDGRRRPTPGESGVTPANVIVQYVQVLASRFHDVLHNVSPRTVSIGTGAAVIFRDGRAIPAQWNRPKITDGTRFLGNDGAEVALRPGQTWILLVPVGTPLRG